MPNGMHDHDRHACEAAVHAVKTAMELIGAKLVKSQMVDPGSILHFTIDPARFFEARQPQPVTVRVDYGHHDFGLKDRADAIDGRDAVIARLNKKLDQLGNFGEDIVSICDPKQRR